jgi:hypothetical protein
MSMRGSVADDVRVVMLMLMLMFPFVLWPAGGARRSGLQAPTGVSVGALGHGDNHHAIAGYPDRNVMMMMMMMVRK